MKQKQLALTIIACLTGLNFINVSAQAEDTQINFLEKANCTADVWDYLKSNNVPVREVDPAKNEVTENEKFMIQLAVLASDISGGPMDITRAIDLFIDKEFHGSGAGQINYFSVDKYDYALVTYFPGDNEYGAIFKKTKKSSNFTNLMATITDGDFSNRE